MIVCVPLTTMYNRTNNLKDNMHDILTIKRNSTIVLFIYDILDAHFTLMLIQRMRNTWKVVANPYMELLVRQLLSHHLLRHPMEEMANG